MNDGFEELLNTYWNLAYDEGVNGGSHGDKANEVLHQLRAKLAECEKDAARYRWIQENFDTGDAGWMCGMISESNDNLDAAIDAAMKEST